jgi:outer membrane protein
VLLVAVLYLYIDKFSGKSVESSSVAELVESGELRVGGELAIAYINSDTLLSKYAFYDEIMKNMEKKREDAENQYMTRARSLQQEVESFQRTAGGMTMAQARAKEEDLVQKQQNLQRLEANLGQELAVEEAKLTNALYDTIANYLADFGKRRNLNIILTYTKGSGVIYADQGLDITDEVLKSLNERYEAQQRKN